MNEPKNNLLTVILIILVIILVVSLAMIFRNNDVLNEQQVSAGENSEKIIAKQEILNIVKEENNSKTNIISNSMAETKVNNEVNEKEKLEINNYVSKVCNGIMKIPEFSDINKANKEWIYSHLLTNGKNYGNYLTEEQIRIGLVEVFGTDLKIDPKNDTNSADGYFIPINNGNGRYEFLPIGGMTQVNYAINSIKKEENLYIINLIEYSVQWDMKSGNPEENYAVFSYDQSSNQNWKKVLDLKNESEKEIINRVLENKNKFLSYNLILERNQDGSFKVKKFEKV